MALELDKSGSGTDADDAIFKLAAETMGIKLKLAFTMLDMGASPEEVQGWFSEGSSEIIKLASYGVPLGKPQEPQG